MNKPDPMGGILGGIVVISSRNDKKSNSSTGTEDRTERKSNSSPMAFFFLFSEFDSIRKDSLVASFIQDLSKDLLQNTFSYE